MFLVQDEITVGQAATQAPSQRILQVAWNKIQHEPARPMYMAIGKNIDAIYLYMYMHA